MYNERILQYEHETMGKEIRDLLYRYQETFGLTAWEGALMTEKFTE